MVLAAALGAAFLVVVPAAALLALTLVVLAFVAVEEAAFFDVAAFLAVAVLAFLAAVLVVLLALLALVGLASATLAPLRPTFFSGALAINSKAVSKLSSRASVSLGILTFCLPNLR